MLADRRLAHALALSALLVACGDDDSPASPDTGTEAATADARPRPDAASTDTDADSMRDALARDSGPADTGTDAGPEAGADAGPEGGLDGGAWPECDPACAVGETCCPVGVGAECVSDLDGGACPLPDLTVSPERLTAEMSVSWEYFEPSACALDEGCVGGSGWRRLMRFSTETPNLGTRDMTLGAPGPSNPAYRESACSGEFVFDGYADYALSDRDGGVVATGHKRAFCLMDTNRILTDPDVRRTGQYICEDQGISRGWSDVYHNGLECQWIDVTDVPAGEYVLRVQVNPLRRVIESSYENNEVEVPVTLEESTATDPTAPCTGAPSGFGRDCGWALGGTFTCTPGMPFVAGCGSAACASAVCEGDPVMRLCPGDAPCSSRDALAHDDDCRRGSYCPAAQAVCPASGKVTVLTGAFEPAAAFGCTVAAM